MERSAVSAKEAKSKKGEGKAPAGPVTPPRLRERYFQEILPALEKDLGRSNKLSLPRLQKLVINMGVGSAITEKKHIEEAVSALTQIAGQKAVVTKARKAVAAFKTRIGYQIGARVTLRGKKMYEFFDRLVNVAVPRIRDFRGFSRKSFDGRGNYTLGLSEQTIFPEVDPDKVTFQQGMDVTVVTTASSDDEAYGLLKELGFPFGD